MFLSDMFEFHEDELGLKSQKSVFSPPAYRLILRLSQEIRESHLIWVIFQQQSDIKSLSSCLIYLNSTHWFDERYESFEDICEKNSKTG